MGIVAVECRTDEGLEWDGGALKLIVFEVPDS